MKPQHIINLLGKPLPVMAGLCLAGLISVAHAQSQCPTNPGRFAPMADNAQVLDRYTGLIWKRCSEGQTWNGTMCTGTATTHTHEQAMSVAGQAAGGWRLPNVRELSTLMDVGCHDPAIDRVAFPNTPYQDYPQSYFWTTTPFTYATGSAWTVGFSEGAIDYRGRGYAYYIRLVRSSAP